jgi:tetratricopeptide (TPR) repeat protein
VIAPQAKDWWAMGLALLGLAVATGAFGQTLALKADAPAASYLCDAAPADAAPAAPDPADGAAAEVQRLVDAATQAMILGDLSVAAEFLDRALGREPAAPEALYLRGRIASEAEDAPAGVEWFCRYLHVAPAGPSAAEARQRLEQALEEGAGSELRSRFLEAVAAFGAGEAARSDELFSALLDRRPVPEALYDRGLVRLAMERVDEAREDLFRYLELRPDADERESIHATFPPLGRTQGGRSPAGTFLLGAVLPGAGHYYTGRPIAGVLVTGIVAGAAATGYLYERTTIQCRALSPSGDCPPDAIASQETERPFLVPALGVGVGLMLISAVEAALKANGRDTGLTVPVTADRALRLDLSPAPLLSAKSPGMRFIRLRYGGTQR